MFDKPQKQATAKAAWSTKRVQLSFDVKKCVLLLCAWKVTFLKSSHIFTMLQNGIPPPLTWPLNTVIIIHMKYWNSSFNSIT